MAAVVTGISIDAKLLKSVDRLARRRGLSRSALVVSLLERELDRDADKTAIEINGVRYVPEENNK